MRFAAAIAIVAVLTGCGEIPEVDPSPSVSVPLPTGPSASEGREASPTADPSPPLPSIQPITESVDEDGIRFTVTLDRGRTTFGQRVMATATIENIGTDSVFWGHGGACPYPAWIQVRPDDPVPTPYGRDDWPGESGVLKWLMVDEELVAADPMYWFLPEEYMGSGGDSGGEVDCLSILVVEELPAGDSLVQRLGWDTFGYYKMPPSPGGYTVDASFPFMSRGEAFRSATNRFSVDLTLAIVVEGRTVDYVSPGEAVDALLADQAFQEHFAGLARTRWLGADIRFSDGQWEAALRLMASETQFEPIVAIVGIIDARSGMVLSVALEEPAPPPGG